MTVAEEARRAVKTSPFLYFALEAGVVNYSAAARYLELDADTEAVAAALRRFARESTTEPDWTRDVSIRIESGYEEVTDPPPEAIGVGEVGFVADSGPLTGVFVSGDVTPIDLDVICGILRTHEIPLKGCAATSSSITVFVDSSRRGQALQLIESIFTEESS